MYRREDRSSLRLGATGRGGSASDASDGAKILASICRCSLSVSIIARDAGGPGFANRRLPSLEATCSVKITAHTVASPTHAFGCGQSQWETMREMEDVEEASADAVRKISPRHSPGISRKPCSCNRFSNSEFI